MPGVGPSPWGKRGEPKQQASHTPKSHKVCTGCSVIPVDSHAPLRWNKMQCNPINPVHRHPLGGSEGRLMRPGPTQHELFTALLARLLRFGLSIPIQTLWHVFSGNVAVAID